MLRRKVEDLINLYGEIWTRKDESRLGEIFSPGVVYIEKPTYRVQGLGALKSYWKKHILPMKDIQFLAYPNDFDVHEEEAWAWVKFCCSFRKHGKPICNIWVAKLKVANGVISHFEEYWAEASSEDEDRVRSLRNTRSSDMDTLDLRAFHIDIEANQHLRYRHRKEINSCGLHADFVKRGDVVKGILSADGQWLQVGAFFLPTKIKGKSVMHPIESMDYLTFAGIKLANKDTVSHTIDAASGLSVSNQLEVPEVVDQESQKAAQVLEPAEFEESRTLGNLPAVEQFSETRNTGQRDKKNKIKVIPVAKAKSITSAPPADDEFWARKQAKENRKVLNGTFAGTVFTYSAAKGWGKIMPGNNVGLPDSVRTKMMKGKNLLYFRKPDVTEGFEVVVKGTVAFEIYEDDMGAGAFNIRASLT